MAQKVVRLLTCDRCDKTTDITTESQVFNSTCLPEGWTRMVVETLEFFESRVNHRQTLIYKELCPECVSLVMGTGNKKR